MYKERGDWMPWALDADRPIYAQLVEKIQLDIVSGKYEAGDKLPSVRELAAEASVNPNTMQKAMQELERKGMVFAQRTSGRFITEDRVMIQQLKEEMASAQIQEFFQKMMQLGFQKEEMMNMIQKALEDDKS